VADTTNNRGVFGRGVPAVKPTFGSLFTGIGGIDFGLERAGWECRWQIEIDDFCQRILEKHWPNVKRYRDCRGINPKELEAVDLICGGFPCQSVSIAGKREGETDPRWLWPEFRRFIRGLRPQWILAENVPGLLSIDSGRLFGGILKDLAEIGYDAEWEMLPAAAFGAPHLRYRVFIVAYTQSNRNNRESGRSGHRKQECLEERWQTVGGQPNKHRYGNGTSKDVAHPNGERRGDTQGRRPTLSVLGGGSPSPWGTWIPEPNVGRMANGIPFRVDRLKSLGNAVVPQVVEWIGKRIIEYESL